MKKKIVKPWFLFSMAMMWIAAATPSADAAGTPAPTDPGAQAHPALGLIVKLRNPGEKNAQALSAQTAQSSGENAEDDGQRVKRVAMAARVNPKTLRAVGRQAQLLDFGRVLSGAEATELANTLRAQPEVEWVVPNEREHLLQTPIDPLFGGQWWLKSVSGSDNNAIADRLRGVPGFQLAWSTQVGAPSAVVAVLDTGITQHPDLDANVLPGYDFVSEVEHANDGNGRDANPHDPGDWVSDADAATAVFRGCQVRDSTWHGTIIAGLVAAQVNNGVGGAAASWFGSVVPVRVAGKCGASVADIVDGMRWAAGLTVAGAPVNNHPARIINISFGGSAACNQAYQDAIDEIAALKQAVVVAAAGNDHGAVSRPASCRGVVGVAAVNRDGFKANYSNFGPQVVLATVGGDPSSTGAWGAALGDGGLLGILNDGDQSPGSPIYKESYGTSFAAPLVSGAISLMLSENPSLTAAQIIAGLRASARDHVISPKIANCSDANPGRCICTTSTCGAGLLDATLAVQYAANPGAYVRPAQTPAVIDNAELDSVLAAGPDEPANPQAVSVADSGGGALGWPWLLALAVAVAALSWCRRARSGGPTLRT